MKWAAVDMLLFTDGQWRWGNREGKYGFLEGETMAKFLTDRWGQKGGEWDNGTMAAGIRGIWGGKLWRNFWRVI